MAIGFGCAATMLNLTFYFESVGPEKNVNYEHGISFLGL
jgi:hypothetical protein